MTDGQLVRVLKALADPKRLRMVQEIASAGELSCGEVGECFDLSQPTVSHHLKILAQAGIVMVRESAQHRFISINLPLIDDVSESLPDQMRRSPRRRKSSVINPRH